MILTLHLTPGMQTPVNYLTLDTEATTGKQLKDDILNTYDLYPGLIIVHEGKIIKDQDSLQERAVSYVLAKWQSSLDLEIFDILHTLASKDPYFLSHLAVNPLKAREEITSFIKQANLNLKKFSGESAADKRNVAYISAQGDFPCERVSELYQYYNRDIQHTLDSLKRI